MLFQNAATRRIPQQRTQNVDSKDGPSRTEILGSAAKRVALSTIGATVRIPMGAARVALSVPIGLAGGMLMVGGALGSETMHKAGVTTSYVAGGELVSGTLMPLTSVIEVVGSTVGLIADPIMGNRATRDAQRHLEGHLTSATLNYYKAVNDDTGELNFGEKQKTFMKYMNKVTLLNPSVGEKNRKMTKGPGREYAKASEYMTDSAQEKRNKQTMATPSTPEQLEKINKELDEKYGPRPNNT